MADTEKTILTDMFRQLMLNANTILKGIDIIDDTTIYKTTYKNTIQQETANQYKAMLRMMLTLKQQKKIPTQPPYTKAELLALFGINS